MIGLVVDLLQFAHSLYGRVVPFKFHHYATIDYLQCLTELQDDTRLSLPILRGQRVIAVPVKLSV